MYGDSRMKDSQYHFAPLFWYQVYTNLILLQQHTIDQLYTPAEKLVCGDIPLKAPTEKLMLNVSFVKSMQQLLFDSLIIACWNYMYVVIVVHNYNGMMF